MSNDPNHQIIEDLITAGDPNALAMMIVEHKFPDITEDELRELLARAFSSAAHLERQAGGIPMGGVGDVGDSRSMSRHLDTMALDLRYNPGRLTLLDQIYLFYPKLKKS